MRAYKCICMMCVYEYKWVYTGGLSSIEMMMIIMVIIIIIIIIIAVLQSKYTPKQANSGISLTIRTCSISTNKPYTITISRPPFSS